MSNFYLYDVSFLIIFTLAVVIFLIRKRKKLQREGILYLYRTKFGIRLIDYLGKKLKKYSSVLEFFSIATGYVLMVGIFGLIIQVIYIYFKFPVITETIKAPPLIPLIPYFPKLFGVQSFFPDFYFTYFIIAIAIVAVVHEFSHGIFARFHNLKIKNTGFAFLGPILGAFVEPDEKKMRKKRIKAQLGILSAGVFANIITAGLFFLLMWGFFSIAFVESGAVFSGYAFSAVDYSSIDSINGNKIGNIEEIPKFIKMGRNYVVADGERFIIDDKNLKMQLEKGEKLFLYDDAPAINVNLTGAISKINDVKVRSIKEVAEELERYKPGDKIKIETKYGGEAIEYEVVLGANPKNKSKAYLGIVTSVSNVGSSVFKRIYKFFDFKEESTYYQSRFGAGGFIYNLLWWIFIINLMVALFNMLPLGILDGGRFFFLSVAWITGSEKKAKMAFRMMGWFILFMFSLLMVGWLVSFF